MSDWILLIPPSESKTIPPKSGMVYSEARKDPKKNAFQNLDPLRDRVIAALQVAMSRGAGLEDLLEVRGEALDEAIRQNRNIFTSPAIAAHRLYSGVMFDAIGYPKLSVAHKKVFDTKTLIVTGLFGVVRPTDHLPPYKVKMAGNLGGAVGRLCAFWRRPVSEIIRKAVRGKVVWDFLPEQHRRVWDCSGEYVARHQVKFVNRVVRNGVAEYKTISHHSKALKGVLIRYLLERNPTKPEHLESFTHPAGYRYSSELSVHDELQSELVFAAE